MFNEPSEGMQSALANLREQLQELQPDNDTHGYLTQIASVITSTTSPRMNSGASPCTLRRRELANWAKICQHECPRYAIDWSPIIRMPLCR